jgi:hypothetical protein
VIFTDQEILDATRNGYVHTVPNPEVSDWVETCQSMIGRVSAAEQVCLNVGQFFELPDEERKSRLKGSLDRWRRARNG